MERWLSETVKEQPFHGIGSVNKPFGLMGKSEVGGEMGNNSAVNGSEGGDFDDGNE